jgi:hypothetical protein
LAPGRLASLAQPSTHGYVNTAVIERLWNEQLGFLSRECADDGGFVFPVSVHLLVSEKSQVVLMHGR